MRTTDQSPIKKSLANAIEVLDETARRNRVLFSGLQQIQHYLATSAVLDRQDINNIIMATMDKIANP